MTACVKKNDKRRVAGVVTASLVGALTLGGVSLAAVPSVAVASEASTLEVAQGDAFTKGSINLAIGNETKSIKNGDTFTVANKDNKNAVTVTSVTPEGNAAEVQAQDLDVVVTDASGKKVTAPTEVGTYTVTVTAKDGSHYAGSKVSFTYSILVGKLSAENVVVYQGDKVEDTKNFTFTGSDLDLKVAVKFGDGTEAKLTEGVDYTVKFLKAGADTTGSDKVVNTGTYYAYVVGKGAYAGQKVNTKTFKVEAFDLNKADITVDPVVASDKAPAHPTKVSYKDAEDNIIELDPSLINISYTGDKLFDDAALYQFAVSIDADQVSAGNITELGSGSKNLTVDVHKYAAAAELTYDGAALKDSYSVNVAKGESFNVSKLGVKGVESLGSALTVTDANGDPVSGELKAGTYELTVTYADTVNHSAYATKTVKVSVVESTVEGDASVFFKDADNNVVNSVEKVYDGKGLDELKASAKVVEAKGDVEYKDLKVKYYDAEGNEVEASKILNAGSYTAVASSDEYELTGDVTVEITVKPYDLTSIKANDVKDFYGSAVAEKANTTYANFVIKVQTDTDKDGNPVYGAFLSDTPGNSVTKGLQVKDAETGEWEDAASINAEGDYRYGAVLTDEEAAGNYTFASDGATWVEFKVVDESKLGFRDVTPADWFFGEVNAAKAKGIMGGYKNTVAEDGTSLFGPADTLTRGQAAIVLYNMSAAKGETISVEDLKNADGTWATGFSDVKGDEYYAEALAWAHQLGIVNGHDGRFDADSNVTREQLAIMLANYAAKVDLKDVSSDGSKLAGLSDASGVSEWATDAVAWAVDEGIMGANGSVNASGDVLRCECAAMAVRYAG